jgi:hypothetical protein
MKHTRSTGCGLTGVEQRGAEDVVLHGRALEAGADGVQVQVQRTVVELLGSRRQHPAHPLKCPQPGFVLLWPGEVT